MKQRNDLFLFLILEVSGVVFASLIFSLISFKVLAGAVAGGYFLLFSSVMLIRLVRWPKWWTAWTLYPLLLFLFGCVLPMLWVRLTHLDQPFEQIRILGLPGPEFHHISASTLGLLFLVTLAEAVSVTLKGMKARAGYR
jgi:hypothetical protein